MTNQQLREDIREILDTLLGEWGASPAYEKDQLAKATTETITTVIKAIKDKMPERLKNTEPEIDDDYELGRHDGEIYAKDLVIDQVRSILEEMENNK